MHIATRAPLPLSLFAALLAGKAVAGDLFVDRVDVPEVLTASRLKQSPAEVPGSMTVLDRDLIRASGARDIPELMRLVPGMMVGYLSGNQATVNYHGTNVTEARRLQVLVDGRSVYRPGLATVDWTDIPVAIEDIDRIEVFRGPNAVSYGANALMGVINILTRHPADSQGTRLKYTAGQDGISDWYASQGLRGESSDYRLSLSGQQDDGFDHDQFDRAYRDSRRLSRFNLVANHSLDLRHSVDWQLAAKEGTNQRPYSYRPIFGNVPNGSDNSDLTARDYAGSLRWTFDVNPEHSFYMQGYAEHWERLQDFRACEAQVAFSPQLAELWALDPKYVERLSESLPRIPPGTAKERALASQVLRQLRTGAARSSCGQVNQNIRETRYDLEMQDILSLADGVRLLTGMSYRHDQATSETYFDGTVNNEIWRLFSQLEWHLTPHWLLQGGAMLEDDQLSGSSASPRIALNYLITPRHSLRAVYSEAVRSPDMYENEVDWSYRVRNITPAAYGQNSAYYFARAHGPGDLDQERMRSREVGYNGQFDELSVDIKAYYDEIHGLISDPLKVSDFEPTNDNSIRFSGAETQLDWRASLRDRLRLTYAYVDYDATSRYDRRLTARNSGSAGWMRDWGHGWSSSVFYYGDDALNEYRFERVDLRMAKRIPLGRASLELAGVLQQRLDDEPLTWPENRYDSRHLLYFSAEVDF
ncbi:TonB-dependent receptor [Pseudomonas sp. ZM23]|uniref:TonB-dependent receptor n=1 Tax=Pseudomonas triclosanedens TaxID=2961893 RepID=A0ABY7A3F3_9PSED|nr:TonB-dependent receptor [Pseudomonas triclosanedens]MCP8465833.1 TonB-dependent receptor [Pseudomonas triclosanedens]MCP8471328.1 TonB-dependent receptor [Pseudomonas triclosanedens]MCP8477132.1 TonB-dependent receptor [Pseudomonas triclosanedens]WAI51762.1 TonB-dependent receptor [Pseudomonas triclosanedens]